MYWVFWWLEFVVFVFGVVFVELVVFVGEIFEVEFYGEGFVVFVFVLEEEGVRVVWVDGGDVL